MPQEERYNSIRVCEHDSGYSVLYDFVGMRHAMCNSCWHEEEHVRIVFGLKIRTKSLSPLKF